MQEAGEIADDVVVVGGDDLREEFDNGNIAAEARPDGAEFEADGTAANHDEFLGYGGEGDGVVAGDDGFAVKLHERQLDGCGTGGDDEVLRGEFGRFLFTLHFDFSRGHEGSGASVSWDFSTLGEQSDATDEFGDDGIFLFENRGEVGFDGTQFDARLGGVVFRPGVLLAGVQERFARDAADVEAGAAECGAFFHESDLEAELLGAERADVAAGAGTDDDEIERVHEKLRV